MGSWFGSLNGLHNTRRHAAIRWAGRFNREALAILEHLVQAAYRKQKRPILEDINRKLESMRFLIRLSKDLKCLSLRQYEYAGNECMEVGNQVGGWIKSVRRG